MLIYNVSNIYILLKPPLSLMFSFKLKVDWSIFSEQFEVRFSFKVSCKNNLKKLCGRYDVIVFNHTFKSIPHSNSDSLLFTREEWTSTSRKKFSSSLVSCALSSGHFWLIPHKISVSGTANGLAAAEWWFKSRHRVQLALWNNLEVMNTFREQVFLHVLVQLCKVCVSQIAHSLHSSDLPKPDMREIESEGWQNGVEGSCRGD